MRAIQTTNRVVQLVAGGQRRRSKTCFCRTCGERRRRVKVLGRLPGELSSLVWAVLERASRGWRGFTMTGEGTRALSKTCSARCSTHPTPTRQHDHNPQGSPNLSEPSPNIPTGAEPASEDLRRPGTRPDQDRLSSTDRGSSADVPHAAISTEASYSVTGGVIGRTFGSEPREGPALMSEKPADAAEHGRRLAKQLSVRTEG